MLLLELLLAQSGNLKGIRDSLRHFANQGHMQRSGLVKVLLQVLIDVETREAHVRAYTFQILPEHGFLGN